MYKTTTEMLQAVDEGKLKPHVALANICMRLTHEQRRSLLLMAGLLEQGYLPVRSNNDILLLIPEAMVRGADATFAEAKFTLTDE